MALPLTSSCLFFCSIVSTLYINNNETGILIEEENQNENIINKVCIEDWETDEPKHHDEDNNIKNMEYFIPTEKIIYRSNSNISLASDISIGLTNSMSTDNLMRELGPLCISPKKLSSTSLMIGTLSVLATISLMFKRR